MPGFFEAIGNEMAKGAILAAWGIGGEAAGSGAVFGFGENGYILRYSDKGFPREIAEEIRTLPPERTGVLEHGGTRVFLEQISGGKRLVICGGGHVSQAVIRICKTLGYGITAIEDREEYAAKAREAGADRVDCRPFGEALDEIGGDLSTAFVVMTREHAHDVACLRRILRKPYAYAGMMGSRSRAAQVRQQMLKEGFDAVKVERLHTPIGLAIGSRTPEEIAVSVAAELIRTMNAADPGEGFPQGMAEELAGGPRGVLAMITEKSGEAPRRPGTKMLVREDGSFLGTIGGGYAEAEILRRAGEMIRTGRMEPGLVSISMEKGAMYCGGEITVFLMPLKGKDEEK